MKQGPAQNKFQKTGHDEKKMRGLEDLFIALLRLRTYPALPGNSSRLFYPRHGVKRQDSPWIVGVS